MDIDGVITTPAVTCAPTTEVGQVARLMREHAIGAVVVVDAEDRPIGIVTDRDLVVRGLASDRGSEIAVSSVMSHEPVSVGPGHDTLDAARHMAQRACRRLPVIDATGRLVGIVTLDDLLSRAGHTLEELTRVAALSEVPRTLER